MQYLKRGWLGFAAATAVLGVVGCGGSGGSGDTNNPGEGSESTFGAVSVKALGQLKAPVIITSPGYTLSGFGGATITSAIVNYPPVTQVAPAVMMENSAFAASVGNYPTMLNLITGTPYPLGTAGLSDADTQPAVYPAGPRVATSEYDPVSSTHHIFTTHRDGTGRTQVTTGTGVDYREPAVSSSAGMIIVDYSSGEGRLFRIPNGSSTPTAIYADGNNYQSPKVSPDGTTVVFTHVQGDGIENLVKAPADGSGAVTQVFTTGFAGATLSAWLPNGEVLFAVDLSGTTDIYRINPTTLVVGIPISLPETFTSMTTAPDGVTVILANGTPALQSLSLATGQLSPFQVMGGNVDSISWGPYERARYLVGPLSWSTPTAAGFLLTQQYSHVGAYVTYNATTPSGVTVTPYEGGLGSHALVVTVEASDQLTSLKYTASGVSINPLTIVTPSSPVTGAIISFNAEDGLVGSIITYTSTSLSGLTRSVNGNTLTFKGKFESVWNGKGENTQPSGATTVQIDAKTGALISVK